MVGYCVFIGVVLMFFKVVFGFFMSKECYYIQQQLLDVVWCFWVDYYFFDYIVQDWQYWGGEKNGVWDGKWSGMVWDVECFFVLVVMICELYGKLYVKLMVFIWFSVGNDMVLV